MIDKFVDWLSNMDIVTAFLLLILFAVILSFGTIVTLDKIACSAFANVNPTMNYQFNLLVGGSHGCLVQNPTNGIWIPTDQFNGVTVIK